MDTVVGNCGIMGYQRTMWRCMRKAAICSVIIIDVFFKLHDDSVNQVCSLDLNHLLVPNFLACKLYSQMKMLLDCVLGSEKCNIGTTFVIKCLLRFVQCTPKIQAFKVHVTI